MFTAAGIGWLFCVPMQLVGAPLWMLTVGGLVFVAVGAWRAFRGWRLRDMRTGAGAEERVGEAIEYALTRAGCAVAHGVTVIAREGDIDHLVATPTRLWVLETKSGRLPRTAFATTLRRIARNVDAVRAWAPGEDVVGGARVRRRGARGGAGDLRLGVGDDPLLRGQGVADAAATRRGGRRRETGYCHRSNGLGTGAEGLGLSRQRQSTDRPRNGFGEPRRCCMPDSRGFADPTVGIAEIVHGGFMVRYRDFLRENQA